MYTTSRLLVALLLATGVISTASAEVFNVSTVQEFLDDLNTAATNDEDDTINVAAGTYNISATLTYTADANENRGLTIIGEDSDLVILQGNGQVPIMRIDTTAVTDDLGVFIEVANMTFQDGAATTAPDAVDGGALGIFIDESAVEPAVSVVIRGSEFYDNVANNDGGAIHIRGAIVEGIFLSDLTVEGNETLASPGDGGGVYIAGSFGSSVGLSDIDFFDNVATQNGGGLLVEGLLPGDPVSFVSLFDIAFDGNEANGMAPGTGRGGGASVRAGDLNVEIVGFTDNVATLGGGLHLAGNTRLLMENSGFNGNIATDGGGLGTDTAADSGIVLINNTIFGNVVTNRGGGAYVSRGGSTLEIDFYNNIIWGNTGAAGADMYVEDDPFNLGGFDVVTVNLVNNDISDFETECETDTGCDPDVNQTDNIDADPLLGTMGRLTTGSPAIDTGLNAGHPTFGAPSFDFEGDPRPFDGDGDTVATIDIGADEFTGQILQNVDLAVTKTDQQDPVTEGNNLVYAITVTNNGPGDSSNAGLVDTLDNLVSFVSATPSQGSCVETSGVVGCNLGLIVNGGQANVLIEVATPDVAAPTTITNTVTVAGVEPDPNDTNDVANEETTIVPDTGPPMADLELTKADDPDPVFSGGPNLAYTLTVTNNGPDAATGVTLLDTLPTGVTLVAATIGGTDCPEVQGTVTCAIGALAVDAIATATIVVNPDTVTEATTITNIASVSGTEMDPTPGNNSVQESTTVNPPSSDMMVSISSTPSAPEINEQITYTVTSTNDGPSDNTGVSLSISLPTAGTYNSVSIDQGSCDDSEAASGGTIVCTIGDQLAGASVSAQVRVTAPAQAATLTLEATVSAAVADPTPANDTSSQAITVIDAIDLIIEGEGGPGAMGRMDMLLLLLAVAAVLMIRRRARATQSTAALPWIAVAGAAALLAAMPERDARAEEGFYLGAAVGQSDAGYSAAELQSDLAALGWTVSNPTTNDTDTAWKINGGYAFNDFIAVEGAYVDLGKVTTRYAVSIPPNQVPDILNDTASVHPYLGNGVAGAVVVTWPIVPERFSLSAKAGVFAWEADIDVRVVEGGTGQAQTFDDGVDGMFGLGLEYRFNEDWSVTGEWERYKLNDWVDVPTIGVRYRF